MPIDDSINEKRKQKILESMAQKDVPAENPTMWDSVKSTAADIVHPIAATKNYFQQKSRNLIANHFSDNVIGDVSEDNLARMSANDIGLKQTPQNIEAMKIQYEPAFVGGIKSIGRAAPLAEELVSNIASKVSKAESPLFNAAKRYTALEGATPIETKLVGTPDVLRDQARRAANNLIDRGISQKTIANAVMKGDQEAYDLIRKAGGGRELQTIQQNMGSIKPK